MAAEFRLATAGDAPPIFVESSAPGAVARAAGDLAADIGRVSGARTSVSADAPAAVDEVVWVGVLGSSPKIDELARTGRLDTSGISGQWESWVRQVVLDPWPGVRRALVIAGSDRRGAIYGIYDLSESIGVSPWYWWADVPVRRNSSPTISGAVKKSGPPLVKYRGIFLNDEDFGLRPWASNTFDPQTGNIGPKTYARVFELLLRLKANVCWPAMHPGTRAFNSFPENALLADRYGIIMGSSHCEQMLRNNVGEWPEDRLGEYNYRTNGKNVLSYWEDRLKTNGRYENIYTVGIRGVHDGEMAGGGTIDEKAALLQKIIGDQRGILSRWVNPDPSRAPQIFCPYKEVLDIYRRMSGLPEDITLVWPDDDYGYIRHFPSDLERRRSGGTGVYYHVSYWGAPYDYLWLCSTPPALIREEMAKAWDRGARNVWIVNVGDLKPAELDTEFFLKLAWDPPRWGPDSVDGYIRGVFARDFGPEHAAEMASIAAEYYALNFQRKPEHMGIDPKNRLLSAPAFSITDNDDEAGRREERWIALKARADSLAKRVPAAQQDAFFQLLLYPVRAAALMNEKSLSLGRYQAYASQGRASAAECLDRAKSAFYAIGRETAYYNESLSNGKWRSIMSDAPHDKAVFGMPDARPAPLPEGEILGVFPEDGAQALKGTGEAGGASASSLRRISALLPARRYLDVFMAGRKRFVWTVQASEPWIVLSRSEGEGDQRVWVSVDWSRLPRGVDSQGSVTVRGARQQCVLAVSASNPKFAKSVARGDFVEDGGRLSIVASDASSRIGADGASWETFPGMGYWGRDVGLRLETADLNRDPRLLAARNPCLVYRFWSETAGDWKLSVRTLPTWPVVSGRAQCYAVAVDDEPPVVVALPEYRGEQDSQWQQDVLRDAAVTASTHRLSRPGLHRLKIWTMDPGIVFDSILFQSGEGGESGYVWPEETRRSDS